MYVRSIFVNKMWFVGLFASIMLLLVMHVIREGVEQINEDQRQTQARINELLQ